MLEKTSSESGGVICFSQISNSALAGDDNNQTPEDSDVDRLRPEEPIFGPWRIDTRVGVGSDPSDMSFVHLR
ncbi:hypothetical protein L6452_39581 [Arctium lappa]|uniref:Uncharacterized protein n=1 Tax=Arctium lappa TaxID=4217 RepID=A0ACB8XS21_ARCLA|nr:hypothetical protein L6452_39581 [Arctium lappa]